MANRRYLQSKKRQKRVAKPKDSGERIELLSHVNFENNKSVTEFEDESEVMMLDFSDKNIYEEMLKQEQKRKEEQQKKSKLKCIQPTK